MVNSQEKNNKLKEIISFDDTGIAFFSKTNTELRKMYWLFASMNNNFLVKAGTAALQFSFKFHLPFVKTIVKNTVFNHFCGGETIDDCEKSIQKLSGFNIGTILDYSVEGAKTDEGFEKTTLEIIATIKKAAGNKNIPFTVFKITGIASSDILTKIQKRKALSEQEIIDFDYAKSRIERICRCAFDLNVRLFIDGEETWFQDTIDSIAYEMMEKFNKQNAIIYNTFQMYRKDMEVNLKYAYNTAQEKGYLLGAKLVRGAYMEKERMEAATNNYPDPIQPDKESTDKDYDEAIQFCIQHYPQIAFCSGTHNEKSNYLLIRLMKENNILNNDPHIYFAQLYGMSDNLSYNLSHAGYNVAKYMPYGPVASVMPYLFRRAMENTAIAGQSSREFNLIKKEMERRKNK